MKIFLSTRLTLFLKFIWLPICSLFGVGMVGVVLYSTNNLIMTGFTLGSVIIIISLGWLLIGRLCQISYDENFIYVKRFLKEEKIDIIKVLTVKEGTFLDPAFEIELLLENESIQKLDFMLPLAEHIEFTLLKKVPENIQIFKKKIRDIQTYQ